MKILLGSPPPSVKKSYPISLKNDIQEPKRAHKK